jgi:2,4-dienoyl-CoA reductase (NADPH2)
VTAVAEDGTVSYRIHGVSTEEPADTVILAVGVEPERGLVDALAGLDIPVHEIGDCARPGRVLGAIHDGARVGRSI